jgi:hypothetical protein
VTRFDVALQPLQHRPDPDAGTAEVTSGHGDCQLLQVKTNVQEVEMPGGQPRKRQGRAELGIMALGAGGWNEDISEHASSDHIQLAATWHRAR